MYCNFDTSVFICQIENTLIFFVIMFFLKKRVLDIFWKYDEVELQEGCVQNETQTEQIKIC